MGQIEKEVIMKHPVSSIFLALSVISSLSYAQQEEEKEYSQLYLGAGFSMANFSDSQYRDDDKFDSTLAGVVFGYRPLSFFAIEGREYIVVSDKDDRIKWHAGVVSKWFIPLDYHFNLFGTLGYSAIGTENHGTEWAPSMGAGMRFRNNTPLIFDIEGQYVKESSIAPDGDDGAMSLNLSVYYGF
ncbi:porin family protein [Vibrio genomosp. F6]|nr:porin family protein [Vibrio genomosp. F6]